LSQLLVHLEANPLPAELHRATPFYGTVQCYAAHGKDLPKGLRRAIKKSLHSDHHLKRAEDFLFETPAFKSLAGTTQAIDLIQGGVKTNALPEEAWAVVNHRVATDRCVLRCPALNKHWLDTYSSVGALQAADTRRLSKLAHKFNLSVTAFGDEITPSGAPAFGKLTIEDAWGASLEPAPITPTGADAVPYRILSGTIRATYDSHREVAGKKNEKDIIISPGIMSGNTGMCSSSSLSCR
jgi:Gly-Xaa carboxypeptidase